MEDMYSFLAVAADLCVECGRMVLTLRTIRTIRAIRTRGFKL